MTDLHPPDAPVNGTLLTVPPPEIPGKRQRRPSVRLGDIGDQPSTLSHEAYKRNRQWSRDFTYRHFPHKETGGPGNKSSSSNKTRTLTNFSNGGPPDHLPETLEALDNNKKPKKGTKRVRSNWVRKIDDGTAERAERVERVEREEKLSEEGGEGEDEEEEDVGGGEWYKGFSPVEGSESPNQIRVSDNDGKEWNTGTSVERNGVCDKERGGYLEEGLRMWLHGLGLGRYEPVFEIHEVDEEVLPLLTLEDLKDMGINAVGSRRKLFAAIQKLGKGFT